MLKEILFAPDSYKVYDGEVLIGFILKKNNKYKIYSIDGKCLCSFGYKHFDTAKNRLKNNV